MALASRIRKGWRPYMRSISWKQVFQKYEESIPNSLRRAILDKCEEIERQIEFWLYHDTEEELRNKYEDFGTKLLSRKETPDWKNVSENISQIYDEYSRKRKERRSLDLAFYSIPTFYRTQSYEETILKRMSPDAGQSLQGDVEPNAYFGTNSKDDQEPKRKIRIKVKNVKGVEYVFKEATTHDLILNLKCKIASKVGNMTEGEIILLHGDREMCDNDTLDTYGITDGETVFMLQRSPEKGLMETARNLYSKTLNVLRNLGEWVPELFADNTRAVTSKEICKISQAIGKNWQLIGPLLGLEIVQMDRNNEDNEVSTLLKIKTMLDIWLNKNQSEATVGKLYQALKECKNVTINWKKIKNIFSEHDAVFTQG